MRSSERSGCGSAGQFSADRVASAAKSMIEHLAVRRKQIWDSDVRTENLAHNRWVKKHPILSFILRYKEMTIEETDRELQKDPWATTQFFFGHQESICKSLLQLAEAKKGGNIMVSADDCRSLGLR